MKRFFAYDKETKTAEVVLFDRKKGIRVVGRSKAHPDDQKYASEFTGLELAELRAAKKYYEKRARLREKKRNQLLAEIDWLAQQVNEDLSKAQIISGEINTYIDAKDSLFKSLASPPPGLNWVELTEDLMNAELKLALEQKDSTKTV